MFNYLQRGLVVMFVCPSVPADSGPAQEAIGPAVQARRADGGGAVRRVRGGHQAARAQAQEPRLQGTLHGDYIRS